VLTLCNNSIPSQMTAGIIDNLTDRDLDNMSHVGVFEVLALIACSRRCSNPRRFSNSVGESWLVSISVS